MARLHGSFLIRWWVLERGGARIELEHIQSGTRIVAGSMHEVLDWIGERVPAEQLATEATQGDATGEPAGPRG